MGCIYLRYEYAKYNMPIALQYMHDSAPTEFLICVPGSNLKSCVFSSTHNAHCVLRSQFFAPAAGGGSIYSYY